MISDGERLRVTYVIVPESDEDPAARARRLALEQTVEVPEGCFPEDFEVRVVGRVTRVRELPDGRYEATIDYSPELATAEVPQLLNLLWGNISMFGGVRLTAVEWPQALRQALGGPRFGVQGVRRLCAVEEPRPLTMTSIKPVGHGAAELARRAAAFARGGLDLIKDDHSLADQVWAPYAERVARVQEAVEEANAAAGTSAVYVAHLTGPIQELPERLELLDEAGCKAAMVHPAILGLDVVRWLAGGSGLALFAHTTHSGALWCDPEHGIAPQVLLGELWRLLGADGVILPAAGGRFPLEAAVVQDVCDRLRAEWPPTRPALPVLGGGVQVDTVAELVASYGRETVLLVGSDLYRREDLEAAARRLRDEVCER